MKTMPHTVKACPLKRFGEDGFLAAGQLLAAVFPRPDRGPVERAAQLKRIAQEYIGPEPWEPLSFVVWDGDTVVAHALTFGRQMKTAQGELPVLALAMVASDPAYRGQGLGASVTHAAFARVDAGDFKFCLFQTNHKTRPFYERIGCQVVTNRIVNSLSEDDPAANPFKDDLVMRYPAAGDWPDGDIDLCGSGY